MYYCKKNYIVRDSKNTIYNFYIKECNLILESYSSKDLIIKDDILEYSISIDEEDKIHIVYFNKNGELKYIVYLNKILKDETIFLLNGNCTLNLLNIKIINYDVHIFYVLYYFNNNKICVYHNYFNGENYMTEELGEASYYNYIPYYYVDYCKDNIYILLNLNYKLGQYTMKKFNTKENKWITIENSIYINNANNLVFFVTPEDKAIICFNQCIKNNFQTFLQYKDLTLINSCWSNIINLSNNNANTLKPIVFYKNKYIYVMWKQGNNLIYKKSKNMEYWEKEKSFNIEFYRDYSYISNHFKDSNLKINYSNLLYKDFLEKIIEYKIENNNNLDEFNQSQKNIIMTLESSKEYERELQSDEGKISFEKKKFFKIIYRYENKLKVLEEEKNKLYIEKNKKIKLLLDIIEEKNNIIDKLNDLLKYRN